MKIIDTKTSDDEKVPRQKLSSPDPIKHLTQIILSDKLFSFRAQKTKCQNGVARIMASITRRRAAPD